MGGSKNKQPAPSYEEGRLRDPRIERMQSKAFRPSDLERIIKKALLRKNGKAPTGGASR